LRFAARVSVTRAERSAPVSGDRPMAKKAAKKKAKKKASKKK
jgi:hypothetical protein